MNDLIDQPKQTVNCSGVVGMYNIKFTLNNNILPMQMPQIKN